MKKTNSRHPSKGQDAAAAVANKSKSRSPKNTYGTKRKRSSQNPAVAKMDLSELSSKESTQINIALEKN